jgi:hypothetical protein
VRPSVVATDPDWQRRITLFEAEASKGRRVTKRAEGKKLHIDNRTLLTHGAGNHSGPARTDQRLA